MPFLKEPPLYRVWVSMRQRCENPRFRQWKDYGGRKIDYCDAWKSYEQFEKDMGPRPTPQHTLDRIDNNKGYSPDNCRWATRKEQQRNQRVTRRVTIDGVEYIAADLAERCGQKTDIIVERAKRGLPLGAVLSTDKLYSKDTSHAVAGRKAKAAARTHCRNGHPLNKDNLYVSPSGWRCCRACRRKGERA